MTSSSLKTIVKKKEKYKNTAHLFVKFRQTNNKRRDATSEVQNNIISKDQTTINITVYKEIYIYLGGRKARLECLYSTCKITCDLLHNMCDVLYQGIFIKLLYIM